MSEMLGNQYFLSRHYSEAIDEYEKCLVSNQDNLFVKKKLILCLLERGDLESAVKYLDEVLSVSPKIILETDIKNDDCPCIEIIEKYRNVEVSEKIKMILGILWLYCDKQKALEIFEEILETSHFAVSLNKIISKLNIFNKQGG